MNNPLIAKLKWALPDADSKAAFRSATGISHQVLTNWLTGQNGVSTSNLRRLAEFTHTSLDWWLDDRAAVPPVPDAVVRNRDGSTTTLELKQAPQTPTVPLWADGPGYVRLAPDEEHVITLWRPLLTEQRERVLTLLEQEHRTALSIIAEVKSRGLDRAIPDHEVAHHIPPAPSSAAHPRKRVR